MASVTAAAALAGTAAIGAYLDAKYHVRHDLQAGSLNNAAAAAQEFVAKREKSNKLLLYHCLQEHAQKQPDRPFLDYNGRAWSYGNFFADLQRVGNWLINDLGIQRDEMVALDGPNSAEYLLLWFALEGIGACVSFVNCHLTGVGLTHSVKLCGAKHLIAERSIDNLVGPHVNELQEAGITTTYYDQTFLESLRDTSPLPEARRTGISAQSVRSLIYTSGTTGLPKAVQIMAGRHLNTARGMAAYLKLTPTDKFYTCLPLYHGAAQGLCTTPVIFAGASMTLGRKFSHKTFWPEVSASGANILQYVGELCRYLVNAPVHPLERQHKLKMAWGNGMRPDVWETFRQRFNIPIIHELYAATDGMGATFNYNAGEFSRNAIGVRGLMWHLQMRGREIRARINPDTEELERDANGFVIKAGVNEPGEVLHRVDPSVRQAAFLGYFKNEQASEKRWMYDVFEKGDLWFRSGDVMREDADGRVFFVDRLGDTFRWKSENVSTNEVSDVMGTFDQIAECNVYGVAVPHADGCCGCATIVCQPPVTPETLDLGRLGQHVLKRLPRYSVPVFLRVAPQLAYTGTFKIQKGQAKREGADVDAIRQNSSDSLFWMRPGSIQYERYRKEDWESMKQGLIRL